MRDSLLGNDLRATWSSSRSTTRRRITARSCSTSSRSATRACTSSTSGTARSGPGAQPRAREGVAGDTSGSSRRPTGWRRARSPTIAQSLAAATPDVLLVPWSRPTRSGREHARRRQKLLARRERGPASLDQRPEVAQAGPASVEQGAAHARSSSGLGVRFAAGGHERAPASRGRRCSPPSGSPRAGRRLRPAPRAGQRRPRPPPPGRRSTSSHATRGVRVSRTRAARSPPRDAACSRRPARPPARAPRQRARRRAARVLPADLGAVAPPTAAATSPRRRAGRAAAQAARGARRATAASVCSSTALEARGPLVGGPPGRLAAPRRGPPLEHAAPGSIATTARGSASRSIPISPSSGPTGTAATRATRARYTRRRASSSRACAASGSCKPGRGGVASARRGARRRRDARVLRPHRPRALLREQRQLPEPSRQARRAPCT